MLDTITVASVRNPDASADMSLCILLDCNTPDDEINGNIAANASRDDVPWLGFHEEHDGVAVIVGGGPSAADHIEDIAELHRSGATIFALNGASAWLRGNGLNADYQCIIDAQVDNLALIDTYAPCHLLASQVNPSLLRASSNPILMHLLTDGVEDHLPATRREHGGYALIGGGYGVGNSAICAAYVLGYRTLHCFGFDSSHRDGHGHAYPQPLNDNMPLVETVWNGETYISSMPMKAHAERFQIIASDLERMGCAVHVHGSGLLPAMWRMRGSQVTEKSKYHLLWSTQSYREFSPGEEAAETFLDVVEPDGLIIDFGCGTGRAGLKMSEAGHAVHLVDFAENCRDLSALHLPFLECDLTEPIPLSAPYGFCTDVMEHIPTDQVDAVISNIMASAGCVFFQIATVPDEFGAMIGKDLHLTVRPHLWWYNMFLALGFNVDWERDHGVASQFVIRR
jgi:SAM-dependent methyltransferase